MDLLPRTYTEMNRDSVSLYNIFVLLLSLRRFFVGFKFYFRRMKCISDCDPVQYKLLHINFFDFSILYLNTVAHLTLQEHFSCCN